MESAQPDIDQTQQATDSGKASEPSENAESGCAYIIVAIGVAIGVFPLKFWFLRGCSLEGPF